MSTSGHTSSIDATLRSGVDARSQPRAVALWLGFSAAMVFAMAVIGAITRLTESGLSIMEWAPITGTLPPMSQAEWQRVFDLYRTIPQYQLLNQGMTLEEFQTIFWWEWIHRLWGRLIGLVFFVPLVWFWLRGRLPAWIKPHAIMLLALGGLQGFMGWFMVTSGFADRTEVSQYRLVLHLGLAVFIYAYMLWLTFRLLAPAPTRSAPETRSLRRWLVALLVLICITLVSGGFVAGLRAGFTYNTFPLMDGRVIPGGYGMLQPWIANLFENHAAVQFNHRLLATLTLIGAVVFWAYARRQTLPAAAARAIAAIAGMAAVQFLLGVTTLLLVVPVSLGALHQAGALILLGLTLLALHLLRPAEAGRSSRGS
ncbi:COX15/CtaA family protein [Aquibaculum arenosum]|uniref:Heme A synthase n=1 Tax=Aquibaculum arenosum TaxID=3032591 RepID=A0ABT5YPF4_9PROT|nr:COX15/CtaA family protein [Fodinicurvata sp. CAU 1616]MDF2096853.1 COX15/CtaA family protein [Fodinicurvata sp. CAU 1616]